MKDNKVFLDNAPSYVDEKSHAFISSNLFQQLNFPHEYPALIQVHMEHPAMDVPLHWHPSSELIYSCNKEITVIIDGKRTVVHPGEFALISSYAIHAIEPKHDDVRQDVLSISFQVEYLERMMPDVCSYTISRDAPGVTQETREKLRNLCEQLRKQLEKQSEYFETNQLLFGILQMVYQHFLVGLQDKNPRESNMKNKMAEVLTYVEKHYREPLTTQKVADHFGYTREYLCRMFKNYSNKTFKKFLTEVRLNKAVQTMFVSDQSIGVIAMDHGFPDEKSFFNVFRKTYQMTPAQFRKQRIKETVLL